MLSLLLVMTSSPASLYIVAQSSSRKKSRVKKLSTINDDVMLNLEINF